ncbi:hypothetical protein BCR35DRAFT_355863 [Leucosporidium creatinivorum]|uniref:Extracellular membrane protein CFEM domain-containing protein n=1 Tax=Leucosporidium creatinivorum TaxID=106004 RepID=A0A1Y2D5K2_9BASI|nr:hypothetical protein BCR35DRAFT_355863 [Leucosporidium creatinivorum]
MVAISTLTLSALALGAHVSLAAPSRAQPTLSPRNHVEKRALSSWLTLLKDSVVSDVACATSCVSWLADAALCAGESTLTDSTYLGCMCETDNLAAWVSCASCYVDHMTDGTQQQTTFQNLESDYLSECGASLPLTVTFSVSTSTSLPIFTASGTLPIYTATATGNPETLTQATQTTSSSETSSTSTTESSPSSTTLSSSTSESTTTESSTSTSSSADLSPFTVTSTTSQGAPTGSSAQTGASGAAAGVATTVVVESGAGRVAVALGALLVGALALII